MLIFMLENRKYSFDLHGILMQKGKLSVLLFDFNLFTGNVSSSTKYCILFTVI